MGMFHPKTERERGEREREKPESESQMYWFRSKLACQGWGRDTVGEWEAPTVCVCHATPFNAARRRRRLRFINQNFRIARWRVCCGILFKLLATPCSLIAVRLSRLPAPPSSTAFWQAERVRYWLVTFRFSLMMTRHAKCWWSLFYGCLYSSQGLLGIAQEGKWSDWGKM